MTTVIPPNELALIDKAVGWPQSAIAEAVAIEENQSSGDPDVIGWNLAGKTVADTTGLTTPATQWSSYDVGLFQDDSVHSPGGTSEWQPSWANELENPTINSEAALSLYDEQGWGPWAGDPSLGSAQTNLGLGQQAASSVANISQSQAQSELTSLASSGGSGNGSGKGSFWSNVGHDLKGFVDPTSSNNPASDAKTAITSSLPTSGIMSDVLKGVGALVGLGLIGAGLWMAAGKPGQQVIEEAPKAAVA